MWSLFAQYEKKYESFLYHKLPGRSERDSTLWIQTIVKKNNHDLTKFAADWWKLSINQETELFQALVNEG